MDIKQTVLKLLATGLTQNKLAQLVPCSQSMISALSLGRRGHRFSYKIGSRLISLYEERCCPASAKEISKQLLSNIADNCTHSN
ncbi:MAG: hypothetical protein ON057_001581 [Glomeribacter sp. 1016415]|nr:hypothetical protein [Glomeribacter sp. 1016415]